MLIGRDGSLKMIIPHNISPFDPNFLSVIENLLSERVGEDGKLVIEELAKYEEKVKSILKEEEGEKEEEWDKEEKGNGKGRKGGWGGGRETGRERGRESYQFGKK